MEMEFQSSVVRLSFLCHVMAIKIAWINPCGCIYKHPNVPVIEFTNDYMGLLLEKLICRKKEIIL